MIPVLTCEFAKLRRSLVLLLCAAAPLLVAVLTAVILMGRKGHVGWSEWVMTAEAMWAFFMLPMTVTALTVLVAQLEHGPRAWNHLLALPVPRWRYYAAKIVVVMTLVAAMSVALFGLSHLSGLVAGLVRGPAWLTGAPDLAQSAGVLTRMFAGALLLTAIQLWAALHFRSFVPPLVLGIAGTFVAVAATGAKQGVFIPWLIPLNALASNPARTDLALAIGFWGGLAMLAAMLAALSRKDMA